VEIEEGRLVERVCPHCGNVERRAFGESISQRGELASYAVGWTSGHEDVVGHMTIGIGAGNPDGGSFHIEVRMTEERWGMGLVDRPFERVPQGGRDLTRDEALEHVDIDYVWLVADSVMALDRRAWWMEQWLRGTSADATENVVEGAAPVLHVVRADDGAWRLLDVPEAHAGPLAAFHLFHALDRDQSLLEVFDLKEGHTAHRSAAGERWKRRRSGGRLRGLSNRDA
jgi:hypothetical protein